jgi:glycine/D-amino acid oxidase-like deaminating enzyme
VAAPHVGRAFFLGTGGALLADRIVTALARHLEGRGVRIRPRTRVAEVDQERARVVLADGLALDADALVVAAGTWAERLVPSLAARVRPSRQVVAYAEPPSEMAAAWAAAPMILDIAPEAGFYLVPPVAGTRLKIGDHRFRLDGDPDAPREASPSEAHAVFELCRHRLRDFDRYRLAGARVCFYTVEPRERFLVEPRGKTWVVSACSGHAFKFGPILGQAVAAAIDGRREAGQVSRWAAGEA